MTTKEVMLEFLKKEEEKITFNDVCPRVQKVLQIEPKTNNDEYGGCGEHYKVKCQMLRCDNPPVLTMEGEPYGRTIKGKPYEAICLVDAKEFNEYKSKKNKIIWL